MLSTWLLETDRSKLRLLDLQICFSVSGDYCRKYTMSLIHCLIMLIDFFENWELAIFQFAPGGTNPSYATA